VAFRAGGASWWARPAPTSSTAANRPATSTIGVTSTAAGGGVSLDIAVWIPDDDAHAGRSVVKAPPGTSTGVGAERFRYHLWGSPAARRLGAALLPQLADVTPENRGNLQIPPARLDAFARECGLLADNVEQLSAATGLDAGRILDYLANMRNAVERARTVGGGVIIW
jgi:hypothetical protein